MNYELIQAENCDIERIISYKLSSIIEYADQLSREEIEQIHQYVKTHVPTHLENYRIVCLDNCKIGCLSVSSLDYGVLLDEIYIEEKYRNKGIGSDIIRKIVLENVVVYLWVYKKNLQAISLYQKLGFIVVEEFRTRFYMACGNK